MTENMITQHASYQGGVGKLRSLLPAKSSDGWRNVVTKVEVFIGLDMPESSREYLYANGVVDKEILVEITPDAINIYSLDKHRERYGVAHWPIKYLASLKEDA